MKRHALAWAAIDFLTCLLLVIYTLVAPPPKKHTPARIPTNGAYAVQLAWPNESCDDVDLYVEAPDQKVSFFAGKDAGLMALGHDDLGCFNDTYGEGSQQVTIKSNHEETLIRGTVAGWYIVNVEMFNKIDKGQGTPVVVTLWHLGGKADKQVREAVWTLHATGDERTMFRFKVNASGQITSYNTLQVRLTKLIGH